jgi:uncharacterized protein involved in exopolysaccharide biosynthesis
VSTIITFLLPESFAATARIRVGLDATNNTAPTLSSANQLRNEFEVIQSELVLGKVVDVLSLNRVWGEKYMGPGEIMKTSESVAMLKGRLDLRQVTNSSIFAIRLYSDRPEEAADVANAVALAYREYRRERTLQGQGEPRAPSPQLVELIDTAKPPNKPVRPNKALNIGLGLWGGFWLAFLTAAGITWIGFRAGKKQFSSPSAAPGLV